MKFKSLLLGTAAAFAVTGGAQAADLAIAVEPIDYVKVCDAFGVGYFYIPGTDTCLQISGRARFDFNYYSESVVGNVYGRGTQEDAVVDDYGYTPVSNMKDDYSQQWEFRSNAKLAATAKTMTDLGPVVTYVEFVADSNNNNYSGKEKWAKLDNLYGQIGPLLFGWTNSTFDGQGGFNYDTLPDNPDAGSGVRSDKKVDQIRFSYLMGTWGIMLGLEDPRDRYDGPKNATGDYPDIVLALTGGFGAFDWKLSGAITDRTTGTGWGTAFNATLDLGGGAKLRGNIAYSDNAPTYVGIPMCSGACGDEGSAWSAFLSGIVALTGNVDLAATVSYADLPSTATFVNNNVWGGAIGAYWHPTANSEIGLEFKYAQPDVTDDVWAVKTRFQTTFN